MGISGDKEKDGTQSGDESRKNPEENGTCPTPVSLCRFKKNPSREKREGLNFRGGERDTERL
jgi:hypothetical protein